jgi:hypothetical protein
MTIQEKLTSAAARPDSWDVPGLLTDAAVRINVHEAFLRRFLNPEDIGRAVPGHVRDEVREQLGMERCE